MWELKPISREGLDAALKRAEHYRLLNQPAQAESICLDILAVDAEHQRAIVLLLLSLTDQFTRGDRGRSVDEATELLPRLHSAYEQAYYHGIICERRAKAQLASGTPGSGHIAYDWLRSAMDWYEKAEKLRPAGNEESILRWNTCARMLNRHTEIKPRPVDHRETFLE